MWFGALVWLFVVGWFIIVVWGFCGWLECFFTSHVNTNRRFTEIREGELLYYA
jgi:hypothetical protein